jgi:hypothetical protein
LYAAAKTAYYEALRAAAPELTDIATGKNRDRRKSIGSRNRFRSPEEKEKVVGPSNGDLIKQTSA